MKKKLNSKLFQWQQAAKLGNLRCSCGCVADSVDHVIPISVLNILLQGREVGYEDEENFQLMCKICNQIKAGRLDYRNPKTLPLMQKYFKRFEETLISRNEA